MNVLILDTKPDNGEHYGDSLIPQRDLESHNFDLTRTNNVSDAVHQATDGKYSAILIRDTVDAALDAVGQIRKVNGTPLLVLRKTQSTEASVALLEAGADDVLTAPTSPDELAARIRSMARRCKPGDRTKLVIDDLELSPKEWTVFRGGKRIMLTNREFDLLEYMMEHRDRVLSRTELADQVWGAEVEWSSNVIDVSIGRLRNKIEIPGGRPLIHTVTGRGYLMSDAPPFAQSQTT